MASAGHNLASRIRTTRRLSRASTLETMLLAIGFLLLAQQPAEKCTVQGQVLHGATGEPLRKAQVVLRRLDGREAPYATPTDGAGKFSLVAVEPGKYRLSAERNGFIRQDYGQKAPERPGTIVSLDPGQEMKDIVFRLFPAGVISGRVLNEDGERMPNVRVQLERYRYVNGRRQLTPVNSASTNDLGEYRMFGLSPGRYYVSATYTPIWQRYGATRTRNQAEEAYIPLYYPNAVDPGRAVALDVVPGADLRGIDFTLLPSAAVRVRGKVRGAGQGTMVMLMPADAGAVFGGRLSTMIDAEGNFEIRGVPGGSYVVTATRHVEGGRPFSARVPVQVGTSDVDNVTMTLSAGAEVTGRVRIAGETDLPKGALRVLFESREPGNITGGAIGVVQVDGTFKAERLQAGLYNVRAIGLAEDWFVKSVLLSGQDTQDSGLTVFGDSVSGLEVVLSPNGARIEGQVINDHQEPQGGATVVLVPDGPRRLLPATFKNTVSDQEGRFTVRGIAPGEYKVLAWDDIEPGAWLDPDLIKQVEGQGKAVSIGEGTKESVQVGLVGSRTSAQ